MTQSLSDVTHAMQMATAPVFLILGAGTLLGAMSTRYGRVIDRARTTLSSATPDWGQVDFLWSRAALLRRTILLDVASIAGIATTIFAIFLASLLDVRALAFVPMLFAASLALLLGSLALLTFEFWVSLRALDAAISTARSSFVQRR